MENRPHRIVIVGGGAGGLELATGLGRRLGKRGKAEITLVDRTLVHVWKPLYHEVAAGTLYSQEDAISFLAQAHRNHFNFQYGCMEGVDRARKLIKLAEMRDQHEPVVPARELHYDTLILAVGSVSNHFGISGAAEHCLHLDTLTEAEAFQQHMMRVLLRAQARPANTARAPLRMAIIGGGATGVELAAELRNAARQAAHYGFGNLDPVRDLELTIIEAAPRLLPPLSPELSVKTLQQLERIGVKVRTNERVTAVTENGVQVQSGDFIATDLTVWAAGIKAPDVLATLGLETTRGYQLVVKQNLQTTADESIFAFGDCAHCPQPDSEHPVPPRAQAAHQQARFLIRHLPPYLFEARPMPGYLYQDYGSLISLSGRYAVGRLMGNLFGNWMVEGLVARLAYMSLYKRHLASLYGPIRTTVMSLAQWLTRPVKPRLKLH